MVKPKMPEFRAKPRRDPFFKKGANSSKWKPTRSSDQHKASPSGDFFVKPSKSSQQEELSSQVTKKKPFDKHKWRQNKYSLKNKVDQWQTKRVEHFRHEYNKEKNRKRGPQFDVQKIYEQEERRQQEEGVPDDEDEVEVFDKKGRKRSRKLDEIEEKERKREEFLRKKAEKEEALERYRQKKIEKHRKLNKKTKKGQPVMKGRLELLLERIQESMAS